MKAFLGLGVSALLTVMAGGCGGGGASQGAAGAVQGTPLAQKTAAPSPAWHGSQAWTNLSKLTNYAFQTTVNFGGANMAITEEQHDPGNYKMEMSQGGGQAMTIIRTNGHYYMGSANGFVDLGTSNSSNTSGLQQAANTWQGFLSGGGATYVGPCTVDGRLGNRYNLSGSTGLLGTAVTGANMNVTGTACVDAATGVLLKSDVKWTESVGGKSVSYADTFELTGLGNVPPIPVPAGAQSFPTGGLP